MAERGDSPRLFDTDLLERLSRVQPAIPLLLWAPVIAWLLWPSVTDSPMGMWSLMQLAGGGLLVWTLTEYLMHRFLFHWEPRSPLGQRLVFIIHGVHHEAPDDRTRLLMPPVPAILAAAVLYGGFWGILGRPWVDPFFAFFLIGYLAYDYTHFALHARRPRGRLGRALRRSHMRHHFATPRARWGVSSPLWDWIFRTTGEPSRRRRLA